MTTPASNNRFKGVSFQPQATPSTPASGDGRLFLDTADGLLKWIDDAGVVTEVALGSGSGLSDPMTTRGDIIIRNASNVTARLGKGSAGQVLTSDGTDISWATPAAGAQAHNEVAAAVLTNATATGDSGGRSDHFPGTSLGGAWTQEASAFATGPTVKYSAFGGGHSGSTKTHYVQAFTPSGAFRIEARIWGHFATNLASAGILVRDSSSGDASGNGMACGHRWTSGNNSDIVLYSLDTGTWTARQSVQFDSFGDTGGNVIPWAYIYIARDGSNQWTGGYSLDRTNWVNTALYAKTFTVAKAGFRFDTIIIVGCDFFDVVS